MDMKSDNLTKWLRPVALSAVIFGAFALENDLSAADEAPAKSRTRRRASGGDSNAEYAAQEQLKKGLDLLEAKQDDRGVKLLMSIGQMYPGSRAALQADMVLGNFYLEKRQYDLALKRFLNGEKSDNPEIQAEAYYKIGICHYNAGAFSQAFMSLRQVTNKYADSVYANEAYYYIGLCHFRLNRWSQAVEALERVGTSVPPIDLKKQHSGIIDKAEAGQRLFVKIYDEDLTVLKQEGERLFVELSNANGDAEKIELELLGRDGATYIGSIPCEPGEVKKNDNILQTKGGDTVTIKYQDTHTKDGRPAELSAKVDLVSTAAIGFTDGAFQEYSGALFGNQEFFMRVRDLDCDVSGQPDKVKVKVTSMYKVEKPEEDLASRGIDFEREEEEFVIRDTREYELTESAPRSGIFVGMGKSAVVSDRGGVTTENALNVEKGDVVTIEYVDEKSLLSDESQTKIYKATLLTGEIKDVKIEHRFVEDPDVRADKNLLEAQILLQLGEIFKEVGLLDHANRKAEEGLTRVEDVLLSNKDNNLGRDTIEKAFNVKWELLIVQNKIPEAIQVCSTLIRMFPDSSLVDRALMKIGEAKIMENTPRSIVEGLNIYRGILQLMKSDLKAEAQYRIAETREKQARAETLLRQKDNPEYRPNYSNIMLEYKKCADNYPDSIFAGKSLEKIADFYIEVEDYPRVVELMQQVFTDYPDAEFLDSMLLKWAIASYQLGDLQTSLAKCEQLLSDYPNSEATRKSAAIKARIDKMVQARQ